MPFNRLGAPEGLAIRDVPGDPYMTSCPLTGMPIDRSFSEAGSVKSVLGLSLRLTGRAIPDHSLAAFQHLVISPPQVRGGAAQGAPRLRQRHHLLRRRPHLQAEAEPDRFLHGEIAGGPGVAVAQAEQ